MQKRLLSLLFLFTVTFAFTTPWAASQQDQTDEGVPAFHQAPPLKGSPSCRQFSARTSFGARILSILTKLMLTN